MAANLLLTKNELTIAERAKHRRYLEQQLEDFTLTYPDSLGAFKAYVDSNYVVLPYSGGWLEQPAWVHRDFTLLKLLLEYHYTNLQLPSPDKNNTL